MFLCNSTIGHYASVITEEEPQSLACEPAFDKQVKAVGCWSSLVWLWKVSGA